MSITTEELASMAEGRHVFGHKDGLALAAELITARAKIEAAEKMAEAVRRYRDFVLDHSGSNEVVPVITEPSQRVTFALAAWEAAQ